MIEPKSNAIQSKARQREFDAKIEQLRQRIAKLQQTDFAEARTNARDFEAVLQQLETAFDELAAARDELQKQNQQMLATREQSEASHWLYQDLFEQAPDAYFVTDPAGTIQEANRAAASLLQRGRGDLVGQALTDFVIPEDRQPLTRLVTANLEQDQNTTGQHVRFWLKDGRQLPCAVDVAPSYDAEGQLAGGRWIVRDVSAEEQTRQALANSEARFRLMTETSLDMISRHNPDGTYIYASPAARTLLGMDPTELIGRSAYETIHPEDMPLAQQAHQRFVTGQHDQETLTFRKRRADGTYIWVESSIRALRGSRGELREMQCSTRDITERKQAEHALKIIQAAVEQINESVVVTEADYEAPGPRIIFVNPAFENMTGYRAEEVIGKSPRILQGPETERAELDRLRQALAKGESFFGEVTNYRKNGEKFILQWHVAPVRQLEYGAISHWVAIQRDVTEQRKAEQKSREHEAEMAHVARLSTMGEMASGLAHELNQPLTAINNYVQGCKYRLQQQPPNARPDNGGPAVDPDQAQWVDQAIDHIGTQANRAGQIIRRLRGFVDKREPTREMVNVNTLIEDVVDLCRNDIHAADVTLDQRLAEGLPIIPADRIQIEQVVLNLVRNAVEAMAENTPTADRVLEIRTHPEPPAGIHLTVTDNGPGMTDEQMDRLFEPFFTTKTHGMGVGLNISQSIIQSHEGRLWAQRNDHRGVTFHLTLPGSTSDDAPASASET